MPETFTAACVQMTTGREPAENIAVASELIRQAKAAGADLIMTPETTNLIEPKGARLFQKAAPEATDASVATFGSLAAELRVWLLIGSVVVKVVGDKAAGDKVANRSILFDPVGRIVARYDKIHMFDVDIPDGQNYRESKNYRPGACAVVADLPWGRLGMTVCYDLRFPYLYRTLAHAGADFLTVPAAFTRFTGQAHWHILLRARAIETGCFVFAPAQCGIHAEGRETYGHSLIVAPWGEVLADGGEAPGVVSAEIDLARVEKARRMVPSLRHDRTVQRPAVPRPLREAGE